MPLSNNRGEGFENKIAELLAKSMGTTVQYYYRPSIERGMTRTTLYADECDPHHGHAARFGAGTDHRSDLSHHFCIGNSRRQASVVQES